MREILANTRKLYTYMFYASGDMAHAPGAQLMTEYTGAMRCRMSFAAQHILAYQCAGATRKKMAAGWICSFRKERRVNSYLYVTLFFICADLCNMCSYYKPFCAGVLCCAVFFLFVMR